MTNNILCILSFNIAICLSKHKNSFNQNELIKNSGLATIRFRCVAFEFKDLAIVHMLALVDPCNRQILIATTSIMYLLSW